MGRLGWTEREYFESSPYMFFAACEGYFDKIDEEQRMFRRLAVILHQTWGGKGTERDLWPLFSDKNKKTQTKTWGSKEEFEKMKEAIQKAHGIKIK